MEIVYLIHLDRPMETGKGSQHYSGYSVNFPRRIKLHREGKGAKFLKAANQMKIGWEVVRTWEVGDGEGRKLEIKLKSSKNLMKYCPICCANFREKRNVYEKSWRKSKDNNIAISKIIVVNFIQWQLTLY